MLKFFESEPPFTLGLVQKGKGINTSYRSHHHHHHQQQQQQPSLIPLRGVGYMDQITP